MRIVNDLSKFISDNARFGKPVKIKMMQVQAVTTFIHTTDRKGRASYHVIAAETPGQTFRERCLATAQVADQNKDFPALTPGAEAPADFEGIV